MKSVEMNLPMRSFDLQGFAAVTGFAEASKQALRFLHDRLPFGLWIVTEVNGRDWVVLEAEDHGYGVAAGSVYQWSDSFCSRMVQGLGPCVAPDVSKVAAYVSAPIAGQLLINAYIGVPLLRADGSLFGTLCAIDQKRMPEHITGELPLLVLIGSMLTSILSMELALTSCTTQLRQQPVASSALAQT